MRNIDPKEAQRKDQIKRDHTKIDQTVEAKREVEVKREVQEAGLLNQQKNQKTEPRNETKEVHKNTQRNRKNMLEKMLGKYFQKNDIDDMLGQSAWKILLK